MSDDVIQDVQNKIEREKTLINGFNQMRNSTNNPAVQAQAENRIRQAQRNITYLQQTMQELQSRRMGQDMNNMSLADQRGAGARQSSYAGQSQSGYGSPYGPQDVGTGGRADYGDVGNYSDPSNPATGPNRGPYAPPGPAGAGAPRGRPNYSRLDLIKENTQHLGPRIQLMLSQLQFKLDVERQYKDGITKIMGSYRTDGDRKIQAEAQGRFVESSQKIQLLSQALKQYEDLHVDIESGADADDDSMNAPSLRKPLTGLLTLRINAVRDVNHTTTGRLSRGPETFVILKVEDDFKGRTKATRTDRWTDELHQVDINKGNEVELTVYDKAGNDHPRPIGMLWVRISDINEEMRRKKIETEINNSGWVAADKAMQDGRPRPEGQFNGSPSAAGPGAMTSMGQTSADNGPQPQYGPVTIENWFSLEPVGAIQLAMSFNKEAHSQKANFDPGLIRKGAIRARKEDIHELYGHKFAAQTFYNIMRCALCGELLKYATGMQCSDCKFMCHERCYPKVATKCISKSNAETGQDEAKLNYRIPHPFEPWSNIGASWCCHCGYLLPLGRKSCRKCRECKLTAHAQCTHLVPDFCGMPMNRVHEMIETIELTTNTAKDNRQQRPKPKRPRASQPGPSAVPNQRPISYDNEPPSLTSDSISSQPSTMSASSVGAAKTALPGPAYRHDPPPRKPVMTRTESSQAAAAAAATALSKNGRSPTEPQQQSTFPPRISSGQPSPRAAERPPQQPPTPQYAHYDPGAYQAFEQYQQQSSGPPAPSPYSAPKPNQPPVPEPAPPVKSPPPSAPLKKPSTDVVPTTPGVRDKSTQGTGKRVGLDHFNFLAVLGKGNFGKVMLAETKTTKQLYAIKVLKKEFIIENDEVESTKSERDVHIIANGARHPFLLNLHACFQTETRIYFVMEYISGGDLMLHIQRGQFGLKRAQFYASEVCLALKYFHENGVVYRDLKLDNILLTLDGHIKIADYGLCKKEMWYGSTTSTFCGTPEFMAPEILLDKKYGRAVDWWAFGVLIYQMLLQQSPFRGDDEDEIYDAILADEPLYPIHMPRDSVSILQKLLTREPESRLGSGVTDAQEIMSHAFFRNVNWDDIAHKRVPAPFLPQIKSATDTSNFDSEFTSVTPVLTPVQSVLSQAMQEEFRGFSYSADFM
ncbi:MAG: Serine/threonine kinase [Chrysothrix sp. TS-e1954]|nr:MAG: Serine/threonine kinase [Chrysothrix sp. TS-e1954]